MICLMLLVSTRIVRVTSLRRVCTPAGYIWVGDNDVDGDDVDGEYEDSKSMQTWRISGLVSTMLTPASWPRTS